MGFRGRKAAALAGNVLGQQEPSIIATGPGAMVNSLTYLPVPGTEIVRWNGLTQTPGVDYSVNYTTGLITLPDAPNNGYDAGDVIDVSYLYDPDAQHYAQVQDAILGLSPTFAYWMDDASASTAHDWSGHANDGNYANVPHNQVPGLLSTAGTRGKVARFDGAFPRYLDLNAGSTHLTAINDWSLVALVRPGVPGAAPGTQGVFTALGSIAANHNFCAGLTQDNKPLLQVYGLTLYTAQSPTALTAGVGYCLGFTVAAGVARIYVNGSEVATSAVAAPATGQGLALGGALNVNRECALDLGETAGWLGAPLTAGQHRAIFNAWSHNL